MAKKSESAFPGAGRWRPCQRRRVRRADRRETRGQPTDRQRASEDFVASRIAALQTDQAMDVLQTRRSPHREAEAGDRCENLMRGDLIPEGQSEACPPFKIAIASVVGTAQGAPLPTIRSHALSIRASGCCASAEQPRLPDAPSRDKRRSRYAGMRPEIDSRLAHPACCFKTRPF